MAEKQSVKTEEKPKAEKKAQVEKSKTEKKPKRLLPLNRKIVLVIHARQLNNSLVVKTKKDNNQNKTKKHYNFLL